MHPLENYLRALRDIRSSGAAVPETSYYGPLAELLNEVGRRVRPRVLCVVNPKNQGAGLPDGGFFTRDQLRRDPGDLLLQGQLPARGVMEVKGPADDVLVTARSKQVREQYWPRYGQVLVTNLREFLLVGSDAAGGFSLLDRYALAPNEVGFWESTIHPRSMVAVHGDQLVEFLMRILVRAAPLKDPEDVAWYLASYARDASSRIAQADAAMLGDVRDALEQALGIRFEGERGEHFFRSTLVQTLFYGVFSAWVLWCRSPKPVGATFDWRLTPWSLHVPMVAALYSQLNTPARLGALGVIDLLTWTGEVLNRVDQEAFFAKFDAGQALQYFYEPFLRAFDPALAKDLGVWYTPPEIVEYMVQRVDQVLRDELGVSDGFANQRVIVLDPCAGTGSFPVAILKRIEQTLRANGGDALVANDIKHAAMERVFGFELLPAPFVVAHLQLGLLLRTLGAPFQGSERAAVFLTNALTGWQAADATGHVLFPEFEAERDLAEEVKREKPILVVIGNPPYDAFAGVSPKEEGGLVDAYKVGLRREWGIRKYNLDDPYVRFFRLAERRIAEQSGRGIVCLISNFSYLDEPSFVVMRQRLLEEFDLLWFDSLNGDSRRTGKKTPEGTPDPSVFSTPGNPAGIQVGVAVAVLAKKGGKPGSGRVRYREFWGTAKRAQLLESVQSSAFDDTYQPAAPDRSNRYSFRPVDVSATFLAWPTITELAAEGPYQGVAEDRRKELIDPDQSALEARMKLYFDRKVSWDQLRVRRGPLTDDYVDFPAEEIRRQILNKDAYDGSHVVRYLFRPFDIQWCYHSAASRLWRRHRPDFAGQAWPGNSFLLSRLNSPGDDEGAIAFYSSCLCDYHALEKMPIAIAMQLRDIDGVEQRQASLFEINKPRANLGVAARRYLRELGLGSPDDDLDQARAIWMHALAVMSSPLYLMENRGGFRRDAPRVPLPATKELLQASSAIGRQLAALLDADEQVEGVTTGDLRPEMRVIGVPSRQDGKSLEPADDLSITARWGIATKDRKVMPGPGRAVERHFTAEELEAFATKGAGSRGRIAELTGATTFDVFLNDQAYWRNVPASAWRFTVGGNQVLKKWLSYRETSVLGRPLTAQEMRHFATMCRRIVGVVLLAPDLDDNYLAAKAATWEWPAKGGWPPESGNAQPPS